MTLKELKPYLYEKICIYRRVPEEVNDQGYQNLYKGAVQKIPESLLELEIESIGANHNRVDILIK